MGRTNIRALALVNWRGCFYERYELDRGVTALEGANGAGKTTVMIAAYVALIPDLTYLRFTNVGESARGGDRGIRGRLGQEGPVYSVLDMELGDGSRLLAGVELAPQGASQLDLNPFLVEGLGWDCALQDVLLLRGERDTIPEPDELRDRALRFGGRLRWFRGSKSQYFKRLFELGATPARMASSEERRKFNEMLKTSMVGGISQSLRGGLRDFLLKRDSRLGDTARRMQENLRACRVTRTEVRESRRMQEEIQSIFEAGQSMFAAALHAAQARAEEGRRATEEAAARAEQTRGELAQQERELAAKQEELDRARRELDRARGELEQSRDRAERTDRANRHYRRVSALEQRREQQERERVEAGAERERAERALERARERRRRAREAWGAANTALSDFEAAYRGILYRVSAYREALRALARARELLERPELDAGAIPEVLALAERTLRELDERANDLERERSQQSLRRERFQAALGALERLAGEAVPPAAAAGRAADVLGALSVLEERAAGLEVLEQDLRHARDEAGRQRRCLERVAAASPDRELASAADLREAWREASQAAARAREEARTHRAQAMAAEADRALLDEDARRLDAELPRWRAVQREALELGERHGVSLADAAAVEALAARLRAQRDALRQEQLRTDGRRRDLKEHLRALRDRGGSFSPALLHLKDSLDASLYTERYEHAAADEAPAIEARLGPLREALLVEDPQLAAEAAQDLGLDAAWFLTRGSASPIEPEVVASLDGGLLLRQGGAWRWSRYPERPVVGRAARERRVRTLEGELEALDLRLEQLAAELAATDRDQGRLGKLRAQTERLEAPDPSPAVEALRRQLAQLDAERASEVAAAERADAREAAHRARREALDDLLPEAALLDPPDWSERAAALEARVLRAREASRRLREAATDRSLLRAHREDLDRPPLSEQALRELGEQLATLAAERARWQAPLPQLRQLSENLEHLSWGHWEAQLSERAALKPALERQLEDSARELAEAEGAEEAAAGDFEGARSLWIEADGRLQSTLRDLRDEAAALEALGIADPSDEALAAARRAAREAGDRVAQAAREERAADRRQVLAAKRRDDLRQALAERVEAAREAERLHRPWLERWERFERQARESGVLGDGLVERYRERYRGRGSVNLATLASSEYSRLLTLMERAEGGAELLSSLRNGEPEDPSEASGERYLRVWLQARGLLQARIPPRISQSADPLAALEDLRLHLERLERRLREKEADLKQDTAGLAHNIQSRLRRTRAQLRGLNTALRDVGFGSIRGIELQARSIERMEGLLRALRGERSLFDQGLPLEEALEALFREIGGGRIQGDRLLDYREYLDLRVRVRRAAGGAWEDARPNQLSTGEAIGVGAAVMMVVLKAWEDDARQYRKKRSAASLRFLFLDEATRLSADSLRVLFQLCETLELQLLIAAPAVDRVDGATTYHLVRSTDEAGREVVRVSGRRIRAAP